MHDASPAVERYLAAWNETDPARRTALLRTGWTEPARYVDPMASVEGLEALDGLIGAVQQRFPGHRFLPHGSADAHGTNLRFSWRLCDAAGAPVAQGTDFATLAEDGRIRAVAGFLDPLPAAPASS